MPDLCRCGHYEREHTTSRYAPHGTWCSGNTWAWPADSERQEDGLEVACRCSGFDAATEEDS